MRKLLTATLFFSCSLCLAANTTGIPTDVEYDREITKPSTYLGYAIGDRHITHAELVGYLELLANESSRIEMTEFGKTHGGRPLNHLVISSPENLQRKAAIQADQKALMHPVKSEKINLTELPAVMNINYSIHGNEASGSNAAAAIAYYLAAAQGQGVTDLLAHTVIVMDPCLNPDGLDRFANWTNSFSGKNPSPDPYHREHREGWPNGRTNYYWFDLNRDWLLLTQPESRARLREYNKWTPNLLLDFHEMGTGSTYFFQPGEPKRNHPLIPDTVYQLTKDISTYFADALDQTGTLYFTEERYDDFYMGKGSTMPDLKGAIGILFEQASARGMVQEGKNGSVTFASAIRNQVTCSLASLGAITDLRIELLNHKREFFRNSLQAAKKAGFAGYRFSSEGDPARARDFAQVLQGHDILIERCIDEDAWYVPLEQPHFLYLESMFEKRTVFQENLFYDITAWTMPLAYNLKVEKLDKPPATGARMAMVPSLDTGKIGYLIDWESLYAPRLLLDLFQEEVMANVAKNPFTYSDQSFCAGTVFIALSGQEDKAAKIHSILETGLQRDQVRVVPVDSSRTTMGIDLGSDKMVPVKAPEILLLAGPGVSTYNTGAIWHLIDLVHDYPVSLVEPRHIRYADLSRYSAIVIANAFSSMLSNAALENIKEWVDEGGTLICLGTASKWAIDKKLTGLKLAHPESGLAVQNGSEKATDRRPFSEAEDDRALERIRGAIFQAQVDPSHPLAYGFADSLPVFAVGTDFLAPAENRYQTPLMFADQPLLAGYASEQNLAKMAGTAAAVVESRGDGTVILFGHNPVFRATWRGTEKLLLNSILFGGTMNTP